MKFHATLRLDGKTATGIEVPPEVVEALGSSKRPSVSVTINGYTYRSSVASMGGRYMLPVSAEHRQGAGISAGDEVTVELALDNSPREVKIPVDLAAALAEDAQARGFFEGLSYSNKLRYVLSIDDARTPETRRRRVASTVEKLREGKK